jgi:hypothetical protein
MEKLNVYVKGDVSEDEDELLLEETFRNKRVRKLQE